MNPDSLCAQILRARYYPDGLAMNAKPKRNTSYTWRSILLGLEVVKLGVIWRIGDGASVNMWTDAWLPRSTFVVHSHQYSMFRTAQTG
jgi:hypothetical protein